MRHKEEVKEKAEVQKIVYSWPMLYGKMTPLTLNTQVFHSLRIARQAQVLPVKKSG